METNDINSGRNINSIKGSTKISDIHSQKDKE